MVQKKHQEKIPAEFIEEHLSIIESVASGLSVGGKLPPGIVFEDLVSWGVEGIIKARKSYDPDKGTQFTTYAYYRIRGEMLDRIRREWNYRNPSDYKLQQERIQQRIAEMTRDSVDYDENGSGSEEEKVSHLIASSAVVYLLSLEDINIASTMHGTMDPAIEVIDEVERLQDKSDLWAEIKNLAEDEKKIIEMFYIQEMKQKDIDEKLNLSRSKVCRIHMKVLEKLRRRLQRRFNQQN